MTTKKHSISRRNVLKTSAAAAAASTLPVGTFLRRAWAAEPIKVSSYGGYFEDSLSTYAYPEFEKASGIQVETVSQPGGYSWFTQLENGMDAGNAPVDITMAAGGSIRRANHLFSRLDPAKAPNIENIPDYLIYRGPEGGNPIGSPALAWYTTFVTNTEIWPDPPTSWADAWDPKFVDSLGWGNDADSSYLIDIVAHTFHGGTDIMQTKEGLTTCMEKGVELKDNVKLWYSDEGQFQSMLQSGELTGGQYYHDVTQVMIQDGFPMRSTFPKEGGVIDFGSWAMLTSTDKVDQCYEFINWCASPEAQTVITENLWTAPVLPRDMMPNLTDEAFNLASSDIPPIVIDYDVYVENGDWIAEKWQELLTGAG
jgi:putative spermidine/putrescine transport system substrate-binding protein